MPPSMEKLRTQTQHQPTVHSPCIPRTFAQKIVNRFSEEQIIGFLQQAEAGVAIKELCRQHGFSDASFYNWRAKFGGMSVPDAKRLKELEAENAKLKRLLAESILDAEALKFALGRKR